MNIFITIKKFGHPIVLFAEKYNEIDNRLNFINKIKLQNFKKKKRTFLLKNFSSWKENFENNFTFQYFLKIEIRKKRYHNNKKIKEILFSKKGIEKCLYYKKGEIKKKTFGGMYSDYYIYNSKVLSRLTLRIPLSERRYYSQMGKFGFFFVKKPNKILLLDLKKNKITFDIKSNLLNLNFLSAHPDFSFSFLVSNKNSSEFWKINPSFSTISLNSIYHKEPINFQKYRKRENCIDFGTISMKWKCFDEIAQKYKFYSQFDEKILDINTSKNNNLSAISTHSHIYIFDNRIGKKIVDINWKRRASSLLEIESKISEHMFSQNKVQLKNNKKVLESILNNYKSKKTTNDFFFLNKKKLYPNVNL